MHWLMAVTFLSVMAPRFRIVPVDVCWNGPAAAASASAATSLFAADWSNSTGQTNNAIRDGTKFGTHNGNGFEHSGVESAGSLGLTNWPTANAFVARAYSDGTRDDRLASAQVSKDLGSMVSGSHRYIRVYVQMLWGDSHGDSDPQNVSNNGNTEHGMEVSSVDASSGGGAGTGGFVPYMVPRSTGKWWCGIKDEEKDWRFIAKDVEMDKNRTYRLEWHLYADTDTSYGAEVRCYDDLGTQVLQTSDFVSRDSLGQGLPNYAVNLSGFTFSGISLAKTRHLRMGTNGPGNNYPLTGIVENDPFRAHGAVRVCETGWCGPWTGTE